jgi:hypothetical protein
MLSCLPLLLASLLLFDARRAKCANTAHSEQTSSAYDGGCCCAI